MTQEQISELRKLAENATQGPWIKRGYVLGIGCGVDGVTAVAHHTTSADADFISAANPAAILALIQQRDELLSALKALDSAIDSCHELTPDVMRQASAAIAKAETQS